MKRKFKKAISAAVVSAIIAAQTLMPVAAAGGEITAEVNTKSPVLRVQVPTTMVVSVNELEMGDSGSQVTSAEFEMKNLSETPVNVKVTSEATVGANVTFALSKAEAQASTDTAKPAMWLAAVAAVGGTTGSYEYTTGSDKTVNGLTGTEDIITSFLTKDASNKGTIIQDFYLDTATGATYKSITGAAVTAEKTPATATIGGADFYQLTALTNTADDQTGIDALAADQDIYLDKAGDGTLTKITKGTTGANAADWTSGTSLVYKMAPTPTPVASLNASNTYMYIDGAGTDGGSAAFRYIGALSKAKTGWNNTDLTGIKIKYDITGISPTVYGQASDYTNGYKVVASRIAISATGEMTLDGVSVDTYQGGVVLLNGKANTIGTSAGKWTDTENDPVKYQFSDAWTAQLKGKTVLVQITLKDGTKILEAVTVPES